VRGRVALAVEVASPAQNALLVLRPRGRNVAFLQWRSLRLGGRNILYGRPIALLGYATVHAGRNEGTVYDERQRGERYDARCKGTWTHVTSSEAVGAALPVDQEGRIHLILLPRFDPCTLAARCADARRCGALRPPSEDQS
jgi:hypothetical protein